MKRFFPVVLAAFLLLAFSSSAWAGSSSHKYNKRSKEDKRKYYQLIRERIHQIRVQAQFRAIKHRYQKSHEDAQQMFLEYLGNSVPSTDAQIEALRAEYDQIIADRDNTIAALQQQLEQQAAQMNAECNTRLEEAQNAWQADTQVQLDQLEAAHQTALNELTMELQASCDARIEEAYAQWQATAADQCESSGPLTQVSVIDTVNVRPYAIDTDSTGNIFVVDRSSQAVTQYDATGSQLGQWNPGSLTQPSDIAVDSEGSLYILDYLAEVPLQKFSADGTPMAFDTGATNIFFPSGLFIDSGDNLYVTDYGGSQGGRILVFDHAGNLVRIFGSEDDLAFEEFNDITVDENAQRIRVVTSRMVAEFDMNGTYLGSWQGDFYRPFGIAAGPNGDVFIADTYNNEVDQYDGAGNLKATMAQDSYRPFRIVTSAGRLYVADHGNLQIKIFE